MKKIMLLGALIVATSLLAVDKVAIIPPVINGDFSVNEKEAVNEMLSRNLVDAKFMRFDSVQPGATKRMLTNACGISCAKLTSEVSKGTVPKGFNRLDLAFVVTSEISATESRISYTVVAASPQANSVDQIARATFNRNEFKHFSESFEKQAQSLVKTEIQLVKPLGDADLPEHRICEKASVKITEQLASRNGVHAETCESVTIVKKVTDRLWLGEATTSSGRKFGIEVNLSDDGDFSSAYPMDSSDLDWPKR